MVSICDRMLSGGIGVCEVQLLYEHSRSSRMADELNSGRRSWTSKFRPEVIYTLTGMVLALLGYFILASGASQAKGPFGDIDGNGVVNAVDVQLVINGALGIPVPYNTDITGSGTTNAVDVQLVINAALGILPDIGDDDFGRLEFHVIAPPQASNALGLWHVIFDPDTGKVVTWQADDFSSVRAISFQHNLNR